MLRLCHTFFETYSDCFFVSQIETQQITIMSGAARAAQLHYWSLTRKRIGTRFLGLDHAGNVLLYPSYRSTWFGGWVPVTMSFQTNRPQTMLMEDGYPMHHKSSLKLQQTVQARQQEREKLRMQRIEAKIKRGMQQSQSSSAAGGSLGQEDVVEEEDDIAFIQRVARDCSEPTFVKRFLRVNRLLTKAYMTVYYSLWAFGVYVAFRCYKSFKAWLNPPARNGLENLEQKLMYYPNCIRDLLDEYLLSTAPVQYVLEALNDNLFAPAKDALSPQLARFRIGWASHHERERQRQADHEAWENEMEVRTSQRRVWWERSMISLLLAIIFICFL
ncbi:transmembrane protein, putative [Bodo saltans]|uniref:Transmembrane protein, putative n=1 Tax=Bodo saltans TaxID=75058 RepID=A0A0S4KIA3_BODSA|nr:transmembrane protein, putative [Bodo saltans]|eukprot:CUI15419.1 transmembrane protein, putative [Bodo saltans]